MKKLFTLALLVIAACAYGAEESYWVGLNQYTYDDDATYPTDGSLLRGFRAPQIHLEDDADLDTDAIRKSQFDALETTVDGNKIYFVEVSDISDVDSPLSAYKGKISASTQTLLLAYEDPVLNTLYRWVPEQQTADDPYIVNGSNGSWIAIAGSYVNDAMDVNGTVTSQGVTLKNSSGTPIASIAGTLADAVLFQLANDSPSYAFYDSAGEAILYVGSAADSTNTRAYGDVEVDGTLEVDEATTLTGNVVIQGEISDGRFFTITATTDTLTPDSADKYLHAGAAPTGGDSYSQGFVMPESGSISFISISYEIATISGSGSTNLSVIVAGAGGGTDAKYDLTNDTGSTGYYSEYKNFSRDDNSFAQGDALSVLIRENAADSPVLENIIITVGIYLD